MRVLKFLILILTGFIHVSNLYCQDKFIDPTTKRILDSLNQRADVISKELPRLAEQRKPNFYFVKRDLDITRFLISYYQYFANEELEEAKKLLEGKLQFAKKMNDPYLIKFYSDFGRQLTIEFSKRQAHYRELFTKEKNFKKALYVYIDDDSEYSLLRAKRMIELAINYATEQKMETVLAYLVTYNKLVDALIFDFNSSFDLKKVTNSESAFQKVFQPLIQSDSLELIEQADKLIENCLSYVANTPCVLDSNYLNMQRRVVRTSISDYEDRKGTASKLATMSGQSVITRLDSLNVEGIYKWHDKIVVIGTLTFNAKFENVRKGEAVLHADRRLLEYIRINKLAKIGKEVDVGATFLIQYVVDDKKTDFIFDPAKKEFQYMICYTKIETEYITKGISKFLPPMQFKEEIRDNLQ